jgi:hypothetical protein
MAKFASACTQVSLRAPATVTADGNSPGVDITAFTGEILVGLQALNTLGSTPTLAIKLQHAADGDIVTSVTPGSNTGDGTCTQVYGGPDTVAETITVTLTSATAFSVSGSVTGAMAAGTVGTVYSTPQVTFLITAAGDAFINGDSFAIVLTARTWADVGGGAFTGLTTGASQQNLAIDTDKIGRWLRLNMDIGGTSTPTYVLGAALYGETQ